MAVRRNCRHFALALMACGAVLLGIVLIRAARAGKAVPAQWEKEIQAFEEQDRQSPPPQGAILVIGSSTVRMWTSLADDFPDQKVINRGFGGSRIADATFFADRIVVPYKPRTIVLIAGGNDIDGGKSPEQVAADFRAFVEKVRGPLPDVRIIFCGISPSPKRWAERDQQQQASALIRKYIESGQNMDFVEVWSEMLGPDGKPRPDLYLPDRLHSNPAGYKIRADLLRPHLK